MRAREHACQRGTVCGPFAMAHSLGDGSSAFSRALASNSRKHRDAALYALTQWLGARGEVDEGDLLKIWKGMFYAMWHADKAPVQVCARARASASSTQGVHSR